MNIELNLQLIMQSVVIAILIYGVKGIFKIKDHLAELNGKTMKLETTITMHITEDNTRHSLTDDRLMALETISKEKK